MVNFKLGNRLHAWLSVWFSMFKSDVATNLAVGGCTHVCLYLYSRIKRTVHSISKQECADLAYDAVECMCIQNALLHFS